MVCQNCQSTDIVSIQGQNYCINCGQIVAGVVVQSMPKTTPLPAVQAAPTLPQPTVVTVKTAPAKTPMRPKPRSSQPKPAVPKVAKPSSQPNPTAKIKLPPVQPSVPAPPPRLISDLRPASSAAVTSTAVSAPPSAPAPPAQVKANPEPATQTARPRLFPSFKFSLRQLGHPGLIMVGLLSSIVGLLPAVLIWLPANLQPLNGSLRDVLISPRPWLLSLPSDLWARIAIIFIASGLVLYLITTVLKNAITYGSAKFRDHRSAHRTAWIHAGIGSTLPAARLDLLMVFWLAVVTLAAIGLISLTSLLISEGTLYQLAAIVVWGLAIYIAIGVLAAHQAAKAIVVLSQNGAFRSLELGWRLWRKQPVLLFNSFITTLLFHLAAGLALLSIIPLVDQLPVSFMHRTSLQTALLCLAAVLLATWLSIINRSFWASLTADMIRCHYPGLTASLLSGRPLGPQRLKIWIIALIILTMLVVVAYAVNEPLPVRLPRIWTGPII